MLTLQGVWCDPPPLVNMEEEKKKEDSLEELQDFQGTQRAGRRSGSRSIKDYRDSSKPINLAPNFKLKF